MFCCCPDSYDSEEESDNDLDHQKWKEYVTQTIEKAKRTSEKASGLASKLKIESPLTKYQLRGRVLDLRCYVLNSTGFDIYIHEVSSFRPSNKKTPESQTRFEKINKQIDALDDFLLNLPLTLSDRAALQIVNKYLK
jgi:hypothetical protein